MTTTADPQPTKLLSLGTVIQQAVAGGGQLDPQYDWSPSNVAEMLLDLDEPVFIFHGLRGGPVYLVTPELAEKFKAFAADFLI